MTFQLYYIDTLRLLFEKATKTQLLSNSNLNKYYQSINQLHTRVPKHTKQANEMQPSSWQHSSRSWHNSNYQNARPRRLNRNNISPVGTGKNELDELRRQMQELTVEVIELKRRLLTIESNDYHADDGQVLDQAQLNRLQVKKDKLFERKQRLREKKLARKLGRADNYQQNQDDQSQPNKILNNDKAQEDVPVNQDQDDIDHRVTSQAHGNLSRRTNRDRERVTDKRRKRNVREKLLRKVPSNLKNNEDSTTQAAEPSSEDRQDDDDRSNVNKGRIRRRKPFVRRGYAARRRADSSERNSNDTSPQDDMNGGDDYIKRRDVDLTAEQIDEIVQSLKDNFLNSSKPLQVTRKSLISNGSKVVSEFIIAILEHAIVQSSSPSNLNEIAFSLSELIFGNEKLHRFALHKGFYEGIRGIASREDDLSEDTPRYLDKLGQVLSQTAISLFTKRRDLARRFLGECAENYSQENKANLLASIIKAIANEKDEKFAGDLWDSTQLSWSSFLPANSDVNQFIEYHQLKFAAPRAQANTSPNVAASQANGENHVESGDA